MTTNLPVSVIDPSPRHRAWLVHLLAQAGRHVEPYEDVIELDGMICFEGTFLICDTGALVAQVIERLKPQENPVAVIAYSDEPPPRTMCKAIRAGAFDYLIGTNLEQERLLEAIQLAELHIERERPQRSYNAKVRNRVRSLTVRELQVLESLAVGCTSREIGEILGISSRTVEIHRANMQVKLGALNAADAVRIGIEAGLVS